MRNDNEDEDKKVVEEYGRVGKEILEILVNKKKDENKTKR